MARHYSAISMNPALFARIDALYEKRDGLGLDAETLRVLERSWKGFVRSGAKLDEAGKKRLGTINEELAVARRAVRPERARRREGMGAAARRGRRRRPARLPQGRDGAGGRGARREGPLCGDAVALDLRAVHDILRSPRPARDRLPRLHQPRREWRRDRQSRGRGKDAVAARREGAAARLRQLCRAEARRHHGEDAVGRVRPARSGLGQGAREGRRGPGGNAAPRRGGRPTTIRSPAGTGATTRRSCAPRNSPSTRPS